MSPIGLDIGDTSGSITEPPRGGDTTGHQPATDGWEQWREAEPVIWQIWQTSGDERVCPICGPMANREFLAGVGPFPPLHTNCRCQRIYHRTEWRLRS